VTQGQTHIKFKQVLFEVHCTLQMETAGLFETSIIICDATRCNTTGGDSLN